MTEKIISRFMGKVLKSDKCWLFICGKNSDGYGLFYFKEASIAAHRVSWMIHKGKIPKGLCVLHRCDNRPCVNPEHLFLGTNLDNIRDKMAKGRAKAAPGEKNRHAKVTFDQVKEIRRRYIFGSTENGKLAREFNISSDQVRRIASGKSWK